MDVASAAAFLNAGQPLAGKWKLELLSRLSSSPARWHALAECLPEAAPNVLTRQLRQLERQGLVHRTVHSQKPPKVVEYALTEMGRAYIPFLHAARKFSDNGDWSSLRRVFSSRWMLPVLAALDTSLRFGQLQETMGGLSRGVLAQQLHELVGMGLISQTKYPCFPPRVEYRRTPRGNALLALPVTLPETGHGTIADFSDP